MATGWLKRISAALAVCVMLGCFAGCSDSEGSSQSAAETSEAGTSEAEEKETVKVGYIFMGDCDKPGSTMESNEQRLAAAMHTDVLSCYIDNVTITDFPQAVDKLVDSGCTYIVSANSRYTNILTETAGKNMNVNFISYGARVRTVNVYAYTDHMYEGAYAAGMAAAYNSASEKIGIVADPHMIYTTAVINAAALGTQLVYSDAALYTAFASESGEIHSAVDALKAKGCDVIISYTESSETVEYCERQGIKVIGNHDYSGSADSYNNLLMYYYPNHSSFYLAQFKQMALETWEPDAYVGTVANGVVAVSAAQSCAKDGTQDIIDALLPKLATGEGYIFSGELKNTAGNIIVQQSKALEPAEIYAMDWYVLGVDNSLDTFIQQKTELKINDFEIQY